MNSSKFKRNSVIVIIILVVLIAATFYVVEMMKNPEFEIGDILFIVTTLSGIFAVWYEFRKTKKLNQAVFITGLNNDFINSDKITHIYSVLYNARENGMYEAYIEKRKNQEEGQSYLDEEDIVKFNSYLNFFEVIYLLFERKFINFGVINELFSHRFFLICNDPVVQDLKLVKRKDHYNNIYSLHKLWRNYRLKKGLKIHYEESCLSAFYD